MKRIERFLGDLVAWGVAHSSIYGPPIKWPRVPAWAVLYPVRDDIFRETYEEVEDG